MAAHKWASAIEKGVDVVDPKSHIQSVVISKPLLQQRRFVAELQKPSISPLSPPPPRDSRRSRCDGAERAAGSSASPERSIRSIEGIVNDK